MNRLFTSALGHLIHLRMPPKQAATTGKKESKRISKPQVQQLAVGLKRGHFVTKKQRPASKRATVRIQFINSVCVFFTSNQKRRSQYQYCLDLF